MYLVLAGSWRATRDDNRLSPAIGRHSHGTGERRVEPSTLHPGGGQMPDRHRGSEGPQDPGDASERREPPTPDEVRDEISREILRIHEESYGKGAEQAHTYVGNGYVIVVLDNLEFLPNEKFLIDNGKHDTVVQVRSQYQNAIRTSFTAAIERATGRNVIGFASTTSLDEPAFVAEVFRLL